MTDEADALAEAQAEIERLTAENQRLISNAKAQQQDKIKGLTTDLENAVEVAFRRGAREWVRLNYPAQYEKPSKD